MSRAKFPFASGPFGLGKDMNAGLSSPHCEMSGFSITIEKLGHLAPSAKRKFVSSFAESGWHGKQGSHSPTGDIRRGKNGMQRSSTATPCFP